MKVSELIKLLKNYKPDCQVILAKDAEGNDHSPLSDIGDGYYLAASKWSGEFYEEDAPEGSKTAIVLRPIN